MKAVAYSVRKFEHQYLEKANGKKHDITLVSDPLSPETVLQAKGNQAVIVFTNDEVSAPVIEALAALGVKYIITRSTGMDHIDQTAAAHHGCKTANVPSYSPQAIAEHAVTLAMALNRHIITANRHSHAFDFRNEGLVGFNFAGKTVGLIGLGATGIAAAQIFNGLGCKVIACDPVFPGSAKNIGHVSLQEVLSKSDIISLHLPLTDSTKYMINADSLQHMKTGVMLINTSRGGLINTADILVALDQGKIGYFGMDVYEHEHGLFFEDHHNDQHKDQLLERLLQHSNVIVTPHQAYLTNEALQEIADQTIKNLDMFAKSEMV
ncbi:MAG: 2-hydroxyacid dehydrogenase [Pedobacter sp.]|nr:MAG: 2-hydroxyacid dehydrogenase [Pedobacter sp.]